jgi:hypothetical protein
LRRLFGAESLRSDNAVGARPAAARRRHSGPVLIRDETLTGRAAERDLVVWRDEN